MKEYGTIRRCNDGTIDCSLMEPLFSDHEKEKAERILKTLSGLSSVQALSFLDKCKMAVLQCRVIVD